ncbi:hypothetical protein EYB59_09450 [Acinetobacter bereziniae]|nr:acyltransferase family protein [Acinetobacter bereziniae]TNL50913.1 hypothetical protein EYB59_09450 [Acinetobacter bereziniae]
MRDTYLDSCKATLIFLVVLGHFLERMIGWDDSFNHALLGTIYFIHMPAFIFISGMLFNEKKWRRIFYFLFRCIYLFKFYFLPLMPSGLGSSKSIGIYLNDLTGFYGICWA